MLFIFRPTVQHTCIIDVIMYKITYYTRSPFVTLLSRRAQSGTRLYDLWSGRRTSFGR